MAETPDLDRPRLNPFAFPSDTSIRFVLLLVLVTVVDIGSWNFTALTASGLIPQIFSCTEGFASVPQDPARLANTLPCLVALSRNYWRWDAAGLTIFAIGTFLIWWFHPVWVNWRMRLSRVNEREAPELVATLHKFCQAAGLRRFPSFYWNPVAIIPGALVYGRAGQYSVALTGAMAVRAISDPSAFRATMMHELAHVANCDVDKTWLAIGVWWSWLISGAVPFILVRICVGLDWADTVPVLIAHCVFAVLVTLTLNSMLRARELYADVRASSWSPDFVGLTEALVALRPIPWWRGLASPHPEPTRRLRLLHSTDELFSVRFWDVLGLGMAAVPCWVMSSGFGSITAGLFEVGPVWAPVLKSIVPIALVLPLAVGAVAVMVWRASFRTLMRGGSGPTIGRAVVGFGLGIVLGALLSAFTFLTMSITRGLAPSPTFVGAFALWLIVVMLTFMTYLKWISATAVAWLSVALRRGISGATLGGAATLCGFLVLPWFVLMGPVAFLSWSDSVNSQTSVFSAVYDLTAQFPRNVLFWISLVVVWGFPLSSGIKLLRRVSPGADTWALLDANGQSELPAELRLKTCRALMIGLMVGLLSGIGLRWIYIPASPADIGSPYGALASLKSTIITAVIVQAAAAALTAAVVTRLSGIHGLFAAFVAGHFFVLAVCLHLIELGRPELITAGVQACYGPIVIGGGLAAVPSAAMARLVIVSIRWAGLLGLTLRWALSALREPSISA